MEEPKKVEQFNFHKYISEIWHKSLSSVGPHLSFRVLMLIQKLCRRDGVVDRLCVGKHQRCGAVRLAHGIKNTNMVTQTPKLSYILVLQPHV